MKQIGRILSLAVLASCHILPVQASPADNGDGDRFVRNLMKRMTLEEKIGQLSHPVIQVNSDIRALEEGVRAGKIGSFCVTKGGKLTPEERDRLQRIAVEETRLGIPLFFAFDVIHGYNTVFPIPLGLSATWNDSLVVEVSRVAAADARGNGIDMAYAPMVDISRDPRWGRISECFGEDVLLNARMGSAVVRGFQGNSLSDSTSVASCVKHYVGYGLSMGGRDKQYTEISERSLRETYLPPFEACVEAGAASVMSAFNDISGIPASANRFTLTDVLKGEWGFSGPVLSDWDSVVELMNHGIASDKEEAAEKAFLAGVDVEMKSDCYLSGLASLAGDGAVSRARIDDAVYRVLKLKYDLGLFTSPYSRRCGADEEYVSRLNRAVARESMVLLKNDGVLPLSPDRVRKISVTGPFASNQDLLGWWTGNGDQGKVVTVLEGMENISPDSTVIVPGTEARSRAPVTIVCLGEPGAAFGESNCLPDISLSRSQAELVKEIKRTGTKVVAVVFNGRPLVLGPVLEYADAVLLAWHPGYESGNAVAELLWGVESPSGKLTVTFPASSGHIPLFYSDRPSGRPSENKYKYEGVVKPAFPFGFGLSYTEFTYSGLQVVKNDDNSVDVSVTVTNTGGMDGKEVVQLYVRDEVASVTRPVKELKDYRKIFLEKGRSETVRFRLRPEQLAFWNADMEKVVEPGGFTVWAGPDSGTGLQGRFEL